MPKDDRQNSPRGPYEPWYRAGQPWLLTAVVVVMIVVAWPSLTGHPGSGEFWLWTLIVVLVAAWAATAFLAWWRRGRKRLSDRT